MSNQPPQMPPPPGQPPPPAAVSAGGPNSLPQTWTDPATGYSYYWDGNQWVPHEQPQPADQPSPRDGNANGSNGGASGLKWFVSIAGVIIAFVALGYAMSRGQDIERIDASSGEVSFYPGGGQESAASSEDISDIEDSQAAIDRRVEQLEAAAAQEGASADPTGVADFTGTWSATNGFTYVISQFGDAAVIQEQSLYGTTAYGEGTIDESQASFNFTAFDGSFGTASLQLTGTNQIQASFFNATYGTSSTLFMTRF